MNFRVSPINEHRLVPGNPTREEMLEASFTYQEAYQQACNRGKLHSAGAAGAQAVLDGAVYLNLKEAMKKERNENFTSFDQVAPYIGAKIVTVAEGYYVNLVADDILADRLEQLPEKDINLVTQFPSFKFEPTVDQPVALKLVAAMFEAWIVAVNKGLTGEEMERMLEAGWMGRRAEMEGGPQ